MPPVWPFWPAAQRASAQPQTPSGSEATRATACAGLSPDHFIGTHEDRLRYGDAEAFRCLQIEDELELRRALDRQVRRLGPLDDPVDIARRGTVQLGDIRAVRNQAARLRELPVLPDGRQRMLLGKRDQALTVRIEAR